MKHLLLLVTILAFVAVPLVAAQNDEAALLTRATDTLLALEEVDRYNVTWEIRVVEWIATWKDDALINGIDRELAITYEDHYIAGDEHFNFQRIATVTEEVLHADRSVTYRAEIRIVEGIIYVRVEVLDGETTYGVPPEWREWTWPDQWTGLADLLPRTYFAAAESNSPLPLFNLSADTVAAITTDPSSVYLHSWSWYDTHARVLTIGHLGEGKPALVLATLPSSDPNSPFEDALHLHLEIETSVYLDLNFDEQDTLIGIAFNRDVYASNIYVNEYEDGAPDNLWLYYSNKRLSNIDFREMDAEFEPMAAPE